MDTLESRVKRLERENRAMKGGAFLLLAAAGAVALMGQAPGPKVLDELRTRNLAVVDEAGKVRAGFTVLPDGTSSLALFDNTGSMRLALGMSQHGPSLVLCDETGKGGVSLAMLDTGPLLTMQDKEGRTVWQAPQ